VEVAAKFTSEHPEFEPVAVGPDPAIKKSELGIKNPAPVIPPSSFILPNSLTLWPQDLNANGMFIATWRRK
jgi:16S rRNA (cytosine967-C5)-methyltransferase